MPTNYGDAKPVSQFEYPEAGPYVFRIVNAKEVTASSGNPMLVLDLDIDEGKFKGFYQQKSEKYEKDSYMIHRRLTTDDFAGYLKGDMLAIEHSNPGFTFSGDEKTLVGKLVGANLRDEEYVNNQNKLAMSTKVGFLCSADDVRKGKIKAMKPKFLSEEKKAQLRDGNSDLPF